MGDVLAILAFDALELFVQVRCRAGVVGIGRQQRFGELQCGLDTLVRANAGVRGEAVVQPEQMTQGRRRRPAGKAVVAYVQQATGFEVTTGELDDQFLIVAADPGPDAMQADAVELWQVVAGKQLLEAVVIQPRIAVPGSRQCIGMGCLAWVEIRTYVGPWVGGGMDIDRDTLAKSQFAVIAVGRLKTGKTAQQQAIALEDWIDFPAVAVGVALVRKIPFVPGVAHACFPLFRE
ncbi:hypothetical protein D3C84_775860 [compost metagenome]